MIGLLVAAALTLAVIPNPAITPGAVRPLSRHTICTTLWSKDVRHVSVAMKKQVAAAYGVPWEQRASVEFDHLAPRLLGGADRLENIWAQSRSGEWTAAEKDRLEVHVGKLFCSDHPTITLAQAQAMFIGDWRIAYVTFFGQPSRPAKILPHRKRPHARQSKASQ